MMPEKTQFALIMQGKGNAVLQHDLAIPSAEPGQVLIRTHAVALNPSDWMSLELFYRTGAGMGFDFAGTVVELGSNTNHLWAVGDRVAGLVHGSHAANYAQGSFREYILADADLVISIPPHLSFAEASTVGMGISTASQALYQSLSLPLPDIEPKSTDQTILIYGGSTSTGSLAIQLAKLSGDRVITTCSAHNMAWLRSLNADEVIDYSDPEAVAQIRGLIPAAGLTVILDCIAKDDTAAFCYNCFTQPINPAAAQATYTYASLMEVKNLPTAPLHLPANSTIMHKMNVVYTCFGRRFNLLGKTWEPCSSDREFMVDFYRRVGSLLINGKLRLIPFKVIEGWLAGIPEGISDVQHGKVRGKKLVYLTEDTKSGLMQFT